MSAVFTTGRRSSQLARELKRTRRRRRLAASLAAAVIIPGLLFLLNYSLERSWESPPSTPSRPDFDTQLLYTKARSLVAEGEANEHRGRRDRVRDCFEEALELLLRISEQDPQYQPKRIAGDIELLRGKLRRFR